MKFSTHLVGLLTLLALAPLQAQTTTAKATWTMSEAPAVSSTFTYTLKDGATVVPFTGAVSCLAAPAGGGSACTAPLAPLTSGLHSFVLTAASAFGGADSLPLTGSTPGKPGGFTITVTVSVP